jgi:hypothetical protein
MQLRLRAGGRAMTPEAEAQLLYIKAVVAVLFFAIAAVLVKLWSHGNV